MARKFARKNAIKLAEYIDRGYQVVYACTSCGLSLVQDYPGILDVPEGKKIAENAYNVHELLLDILENDGVEPGFGEVDRRVAYHIPCHLRALGIGYPAAEVFERIPGLDFTVLDDNCCGLAGSYGFKKKNSRTSQKLGEIAASAVRSLDADALVSDCGACRMQLGHLSGLPALDPSEIIIASLALGASQNTREKRR
jgi:glycerol-3-phosphate dehydrogenase subunit C